MKKYIVPVVTGIAALIVGVVIGIKMAAHVYDNNTESSYSKVTENKQPKTVKVNKTVSNDVWNVTLDSITTEKLTKSDSEHFSATNDFDIKKLLPNEYYMTTVEMTLENKLDQDIDGTRSSGSYTLIDGDGNSRSIDGTTLSSYSDLRPITVEKFPSKSKTKIQFVVLSDKNDFNSKGLRVSIPDFAKGQSMDDVYRGGTFDFKN